VPSPPLPPNPVVVRPLSPPSPPPHFPPRAVWTDEVLAVLLFPLADVVELPPGFEAEIKLALAAIASTDRFQVDPEDVVFLQVTRARYRRAWPLSQGQNCVVFVCVLHGFVCHCVASRAERRAARMGDVFQNGRDSSLFAP